jgi:nicotinamide phosphoribosyltransferase
LDSHIGAIYGDSITITRATQICERLKEKGFASTNIVLGIGSYTYQYNTRDTFGFAMKATYGEVNGQGRAIFKDPITDDGLKKSAKGLIKVEHENGAYRLIDQVTWEQEGQGELREVFRDGKLLIDYTLAEIRQQMKK